MLGFTSAALAITLAAAADANDDGIGGIDDDGDGGENPRWPN